MYFISKIYISFLSKGLQLVFVIGSSASSSNVQRTNFDAQRQLIRTMINRYKISPQDTQVGVITYGRMATAAINLRRYEDKSTLLAGVGKIGNPGAGSRIDLGVSEGIAMLRGAKKDGFQQRLVVIFDGKAEFNLAKLATELKEDSVETIAIGLGGDADKSDIEALSPDGKGRAVDAADKLDDIADAIEKPG